MSTKNESAESAKLKELKEQSVLLIKGIMAKKTTGGSGKDGLDGGKKGVSGPIITGKGNFDELMSFLTTNKVPIDQTIKTKLGMVYKYINDTPTPTSDPTGPAGI